MNIKLLMCYRNLLLFAQSLDWFAQSKDCFMRPKSLSTWPLQEYYFSVCCMHMYSFAGLIKLMSESLQSLTATLVPLFPAYWSLYAHCLVYWLEEIDGTVAACKSWTHDSLKENRKLNPLGRVVQSIACLTQEPEVPCPYPDPATYFRFSFHWFKKGSCQLLAKVCAQSTG